MLAGKRSLFQKDKEAIKNKLETINLSKLNKKKSDKIKNRALNYMTKVFNPPSCKICFEPLNFDIVDKNKLIKCENELNTGNTNICTAAGCGHTFHASCISNLINHNVCPYCRTECMFTRLFL